MGLYNRLIGTNQPADWKSTHPVAGNEDKNMDWFSWHIAVHPFSDMVRLYADGELGTGQQAVNRMRELFDLSSVEIDQMVEIWNGFINVPAGDVSAQRSNIERLQAVLRAMEREIPQRYFADTRGWLYTKLGITTQDER